MKVNPEKIQCTVFDRRSNAEYQYVNVINVNYFVIQSICSQIVKDKY